MSFPGLKQAPKNRISGQYIPHGNKRPDNLPGNAPWSIGKKKGKQLKQEMARHSMDFEDKFNALDAGTDFRTRSRTFSDLNNMDLQQESGDPYASGSQSTIASETTRNASAKLLHSSNNPVNYSNTNIHKDTLGSPIWKPRHQSSKQRNLPTKSPLSSEERTLESTVFSGSAYSDYSSIVYDDKHSALLLTPSNTYHVEHEDTEC